MGNKQYFTPQVEESFNTQAIHDIIYNTKYLYYYDHISFPGPLDVVFVF